MKLICRVLLLSLLIFSAGCGQKKEEQQPVLTAISRGLTDTTYSYFVDFKNYPQERKHLPIGIFDSGTGGLTVMEAILAADNYDNITGEECPDGIRDFAGEDFVYLADQANMPYGNYSSENKSEYLRELVVKDGLFLLGAQNNRPIKTMVIACNTATAYGLEDMKKLLSMSESSIVVTGVINAGVKACLDNITKDESAAVGVLATVGTIASGGYERTIREMSAQREYTGEIQIVNQGCMGFAEAVDGEKDFVNKGLWSPRDSYRGPSLDHESFKIDTQLLPAYNFDFSRNRMLYSPSKLRPEVMQLNAAQNYARYHLLSLVEQLRNTARPQKLKCLILGCTHYPYYKDVIVSMLLELRNFRHDGRYVYRDIIDENVVIIDPAVETAREVYKILESDGLLAHNARPSEASFYITVPISDASGSNVDSLGRFTYSYKYGRLPGGDDKDVETKLFDNNTVEPDVLERLHQNCPYCYSLIRLP